LSRMSVGLKHYDDILAYPFMCQLIRIDAHFTSHLQTVDCAREFDCDQLLNFEFLTWR